MNSYNLASTLSTSLDSTSLSLTSLIQTLNTLSPSLAPTSSSSAPSSSDEDPLAQIAAILNAHLGSLKWIESNTEGLRRNVRDLEGRVGEVKGRMEGQHHSHQQQQGGRGGQQQGGGQGTPVQNRFGASQLGRTGGGGSPFTRRI